MRICFVCGKLPPVFSGAGLRIDRQAAGLVDRGHEVLVIGSSGGIHDRPYQLKIIGKGQRVGAKLWRLVPELLGCWRAVRDFGPHVIHVVSGGRLNMLVLLISRLLHIPVIYGSTLLGSDDPLSIESGLLGKARCWLIRQCNGVVAISPALREAAIAARVDQARVYLIGNDVDCERFAPVSEEERRRVRAELGLSPHELVFVTIGAVIPRKGTLAIVSAFVAARLKANRACLCIVGPVPETSIRSGYKKQLDQLIRTLKDRKRIIFTGNVPDPSIWLAVADGFVFASRQEGFGTVLIEAMSSGLPIAMRELPGISGFIAGKEAGVIRVSRDEELAKALEEIEDIAGSREVKAGLRRRAVEKFSSSRILGQYEALFSSVAAGIQK